VIDGGLRQLLRQNIPRAHWVPIETGGTGRGIPDMNYCLDGAEGWIEGKQTSGWTVDLRPEQVAWLERRARAGGRVLIAVRRVCAPGPRRVGADELWLLRGSQARMAKTLGLRGATPEGELLLGVWSGGPARWDWDEVCAHLVA
jgi:hypothetical protein